MTLLLLAAAIAADPVAVKEVLAGKRDTANAAWWGFDDEDSTAAIQAALDSPAKRVVVPNVGRDWIVLPLQLRSNQEVLLERGAVVAAKRGAYRGGGDSVLNVADAANVAIRGYGATVRMNKDDYMVGYKLKELGWNRWFGQYPKAEWRMALSIRGSSDIAVEGLTLADSGGDGIYVAGGRARDHCRNIRIKDVVCDNNYRQGISVISVDGLLVENSVFRNTWGTPPSAGVDIEPDSPKERLRNIVFRDCRFEDNYGDGIEVYLAHQTRDSEEVSILFERCRVSTRRGTGIRVAKVGEGGVRGSVVFRDCVVDGSEGYGIKIQDKAASGARVRFERCELRNTALRRSYNGKFAPVWLQLLRPEMTSAPGGIDFVDCVVEDALRREIVAIDGGDWKDVNRGIALR